MRNISTLWLGLVAILLAVSCGQEDPKQVGDDLVAGPVSLDEATMSARIVGDSLEIYVPLANSGTASVKGTAAVDVTHLGDGKTLTGSTSFKLPGGGDTVVLRLNPAPALSSVGEQAQWLVNYKIDVAKDDISGKRSLFMLLPKADLLLMMPDELVHGQVTKLKALLIDPRTHTPIPNQTVSLEVQRPDGPLETFTADTDSAGVALVEVPAQEEEGELEVKALVYGDETQGTVEANVSVVRDSRLLLTTDKPLYQPGQTIHLRALGLNRFDKAPLAGEEMLFEVLDAKGNKVFKRADEANAYGIAWAEFKLATQVLLGPYTIRVTAGDVVSEKTITVDRYALPKFKVDATLDRGFYQPGQTVHGEVDVQYFFGKPVAGGTVKVVVYNYAAEWVPDTEIVGQTNDAGLYSFDYTLPAYVIGQPVEGGKGLVLMEIFVTDTAEHEQKVAKQLLVAESLLDIALIPESGDVVPDVENLFYLFVSDPTGQPVGGSCTLTVNGAEFDDAEDEVVLPPSGPATVALTPHKGTLSVTVEAEDGQGNTATHTFDYSVGSQEAGILLRTDRALYKVGDTMEVKAYITGGYDRIFLDMVRKGQTVRTDTLQTEDGVATLLVDLDSELMSEDLAIDAYFLADNGQFIRDTAVVYVQPATDLSVSVATDKEEYQPGETAVVEFSVTDEAQQPAQAALGLQVVDEAVFALSEIKPGLMKLYFQLEEELQQTSYQIGPAGGVTLGGLLSAGAAAEPGSEEDAAIQDTTKAMFANLDSAGLTQQRLSSWAKTQAAAKAALAPLFETQKAKIRDKLETRLANTDKQWEEACPYLQEYLATARYYDYWDRVYTFAVSGDNWNCKITMTSSGPDELADTADDWSGSLDLWELAGERWGGGQYGPPMAGGWEENADFDGGEPTAEPGAVDDEQKSNDGSGDDKSGVKVRNWFPETLFVAPALITDASGKATVEIPLADSITEWRMTTMANSGKGELGSRTDGIVVFQDFFVDIDFPKYLTQNDEISFPVAVYNYLPQAQTVSVEVMPEDWFDLLGADQKTLTLEAGEVTVVYFPVRVNTVGWHKMTVYGMGDTLQDAVQRTVEVKPDGKEMLITESARFANDGETPSTDHVTQTVSFPAGSIANSQSIVVKVLPGLSTHIVEGMESLLKMPTGCFEQTTSSAWPNVLAMSYMLASDTITPEIEMKAMEYINTGYQRLLTFECESGGFNWWEGDNPGNAILSALSIMMFTDTKVIYDTVDEKVNQRSADYLASVQKADGSWSEESHLHAGNENLGASSLRGTCYVAWALAYGGFGDMPAVSKALSFINGNLAAADSDYTRAMCANALIAAGSGAQAGGILKAFHDAAIVEDGTVHWSVGQGDTIVNSGGNAADVELTALIALAMANQGSYPQDVNGAVEWLVQSKDPQGSWGYNTQATVLALKVFLAALTANPGNADADVTVILDGEILDTKHFDNFNKDVVYQVEVTQGLSAGDHVVELDYEGTGALSYQIVGGYYVPWEEATLPEGPLTIDVSYDTTSVHVDDIITATVTITNNDVAGKGAVLVTVGLPPGFTLVTQDLAQLKADGALANFEVMGKQLILYFDEIPAGDPVQVSYQLIADYPIKAETGGSEVKYYYNAEEKGEDASQEIEVIQ